MSQPLTVSLQAIIYPTRYPGTSDLAACAFLVLFSALTQGLAVAAAYWCEPQYLVAEVLEHIRAEQAVLAPDAAEVTRHLRDAGRAFAYTRVLWVLWDTMRLSAAWLVVGLMFRAVRTDWAGRALATCEAIAIAGMVPTVLYVVRQIASVAIGGDPGPVTIGGIVSEPWSTWLYRIDLGRLWWAWVAAAGLGSVWGRSHGWAATVTITVTFLWMVIAGHTH